MTARHCDCQNKHQNDKQLLLGGNRKKLIFNKVKKQELHNLILKFWNIGGKSCFFFFHIYTYKSTLKLVQIKVKQEKTIWSCNEISEEFFSNDFPFHYETTP